jgi:hypothetical protein
MVLFASTLATASAAPVVPPQATKAAAKPSPSAHATLANTSLYSPRARRLVQTYLRLRLLEAREEELARVRAVIEHRLGVAELFAERRQ